jgi:beta-glucosidase
MIPSAGFNPGVPRLGIPPIRETDASLGVANVFNSRRDDTATALPAGLSLAASFDPGLARRAGASIGAEARNKTFNVLLAGGVNLTRDPWAGRNFEYLGEDPLLAGILAGEAIAGVQSKHIASTVKHYLLNSQETGRMVLDAKIDDEALRESDLLAFEIALEIGRPASVMCSYNQINGAYACENAALLNGVLKAEWGFRGWVMSDWGAVHSTEKAALAGLDQESGMELDQILHGYVPFSQPLVKAVKEGRVPQARIDEMVRRILFGLIQSGAMDAPPPETPEPIDEQGHAQVAQQVAEEGSVLLRNEDHVLPLPRSVARIVLIGGHADVGVLSGGGSSQVRSVGGVPLEMTPPPSEGASIARITYHASSPLLSIRALVPQADVSFLDGMDAAAAARAASAADVAIVFATQWRSEGVDLESLSLTDAQDALIESVAAANRRTIVVLETGGAVLMPWLDHVSAVLEAWYPGQRGGEAIARILFGEVNPSARLPLSFPADASQSPRRTPPGLELLRERAASKTPGASPASLPSFTVNYSEGANVGYRWYELKNEIPLYSFGYGLSFSSFQYSHLRIERHRHPSVSFEITNTGDIDGTDVPQVYVRAADKNGESTWRLAGFTRVETAPHSSQRIEIALDPRTFARWDQAARCWRLPARDLPIAIAHSATDLVLTGTLTGMPARFNSSWAHTKR